MAKDTRLFAWGLWRVGLALVGILGGCHKVNHYCAEAAGAESGWAGGECACSCGKGSAGDEAGKSSAGGGVGRLQTRAVRGAACRRSGINVAGHHWQYL